MKYHSVAATFSIAMLISSVAWSDAIRVKEVRRVNAPAEKIWSLTGGFNDLDKWHPAIAKSEYDPVKKTRTLTTKDGGQIVEELLVMTDHSYSYRILSSPLPVANYTSTLHVAPINQNSSEITWMSEFQPKGASEPEAQKVISGIYKDGFDSIEKLLKQ